MLVAAMIFAVENVLYHLFANPTEQTDTSVFMILSFLINVIIVCIAINSSIRDEKNPEIEQRIKSMVVASFFIRIAILLWDVYARDIFILPNSEGDAEWYHNIGVSFAFGGRSNEVDFNRYSYYVGQFYRFIGIQKLTVQFFHVFLAICSVILIYKILCMFGLDAKVKKRAMLFACFLPNLMMITTFFLQESVIAFFIILSLYLYTKWWFGGNTLNIILSVASSFIGSVLHIGGIVCAIGILSTLFLVNSKDRKLHITTVRMVAVVFMIFAVLALISVFGDDLLRKMGGELTVESVTGTTDVKETGGSAYAIGIQGLPPLLDLIVNTPIRAFYFAFSPLPWQWRGLSDIFAFFGSTIFYIYLVIQTIKTYRSKATRTLSDDNITSYMFVLVVIVIIAMVMFGWGVSNAGTVIRHREKFTYICIVMFAITQEIMLRQKGVDTENEESISDSSDLQRRKIFNTVR